MDEWELGVLGPKIRLAATSTPAVTHPHRAKIDECVRWCGAWYDTKSTTEVDPPTIHKMAFLEIEK